jgi:hypothetical protein
MSPREMGNFPGEGVPLRIRSAGSQWSLEAPAAPYIPSGKVTVGLQKNLPGPMLPVGK